MVKVVGGDQLDKVLAEIARKINKEVSVSVGFLADATYPDGTNVAMIAAIQEYGAPSIGIPSRPFFRGMINEKSSEWPEAIAQLLTDNDYDAERTLTLAGAAIAGQLQEAITRFSGAPLSPRTIKRKGHAKQLVDTGQLLNSVGYEVKSS